MSGKVAIFQKTSLNCPSAPPLSSLASGKTLHLEATDTPFPPSWFQSWFGARARLSTSSLVFHRLSSSCWLSKPVLGKHQLFAGPAERTTLRQGLRLTSGGEGGIIDQPKQSKNTEALLPVFSSVIAVRCMIVEQH